MILMNRTRGGRRVHRPDVMERLAQARPASLDPPAEPLPRSRDIATAIATSAGPHDGVRSPSIRRRRTAVRVALPAGLALAAVVAVLLASPPGVVPPAARSHRDAAPQVKLTARDVLLTAATHVAPAPVTGRYWRTKEISGELLPTGTSANPYDMFLPVSYDQWTPRLAGRREWSIYQMQGAVPATPADAAAWHATGSPARWSYFKTSVTTAAAPPGATWQVSDGTAGLVEGDEPGLTPARFRAMPASPPYLLARLRHYAMLTWCGRHLGGGCATVDQLVWGEAVNLLQDPVTSQVRAATFRVMAGLPGVRLLGKMRDPLGRPGYGFGTGPSAGGSIAVINPQTGSLLATEAVGHAPRTAGCPQQAAARVAERCHGPSYYGRSYRGQVTGYEVLVSEGWTNASPALPPPSAWLGPNGQKG
jgi:hypothetical protein